MRRPASYVALLVLLQLATTAPIPVRLPEDCKSHLTCRTHLQISDSTPATPPTTLLFPHFPTHELIGKRPQDENALDDEEPFDNHPLTPAANMNPSEALSSLTPLSSSYLLSLTSPSQPPPQSPPHDHVPLDNLPAKPTSSLSHLRKLDSIRYWTSSRTDLNYAAKTEELQTQDLRDSSVSPIVRCGEFLVSASNSAYLRVGQPIRLARDHSDLVVVGIVVLFLIVVVVVELGQKMVSLKARSGARCRRGEIFLDDDKVSSCTPGKPFFLQPAPPPKTARPAYRDHEEDNPDAGISGASEKL